jgi:thymidylate synthase (FAD)
LKKCKGEIIEQYKKPKARLLHASPLILGEIGGRVCYNSFDLSENELVNLFKKEPDKFLEELSKNKDIDHSDLLDKLFNVYFHESVAEHINLSFYVKNVSREIIIEWNRHRIGMPTSQKSSRYTIEDLINAWIDYNESIIPNSKLNDDKAYHNFYEVVSNNIIHLNKDLIETIVSYLDNMLIHYNYEEPLKKGLTGGAKKKQNDRVKRILPESWLTEGIWTFNLRSLKHFIELRGSGSAYYGIREVVEAILEQVPHKYRVLVDKKYRKELNKGETNE